MIVNTSNVDQNVDIILADGTKASVTIMPKARVSLPKGARPCKNWQVLNKGSIKDLSVKTSNKE